jgi:hypothetical protein
VSPSHKSQLVAQCSCQECSGKADAQGEMEACGQASNHFWFEPVCMLVHETLRLPGLSPKSTWLPSELSCCFASKRSNLKDLTCKTDFQSLRTLLRKFSCSSKRSALLSLVRRNLQTCDFSSAATQTAHSIDWRHLIVAVLRTI